MQDKPIQYKLGDLVLHKTFGLRDDTLGIVVKLGEWKDIPSVKIQWLNGRVTQTYQGHVHGIAP